LTIQCAWPNKRGTSRFAASVDAAENPGIPGIMSHGDSMRDEPGSNHRCRTARSVAWAIRGAAGTLCLLVHGCEPGHGGAVELSWKLRPASSGLTEKFVDCVSEQPLPGTLDPTDTTRLNVAMIRLHWEVEPKQGDAPREEGSQAWPCQDNQGVTGFALAEGSANLWVTPECEGGVEAAPDTYIAPARVQRTVIRGDTVSLGAVELVVSVSDCAGGPNDVPGVPVQPCICCFNPPCN
jgi:hypothetical protein